MFTPVLNQAIPNLVIYRLSGALSVPVSPGLRPPAVGLPQTLNGRFRRRGVSEKVDSGRPPPQKRLGTGTSCVAPRANAKHRHRLHFSNPIVQHAPEIPASPNWRGILPKSLQPQRPGLEARTKGGPPPAGGIFTSVKPTHVLRGRALAGRASALPVPLSGLPTLSCARPPHLEVGCGIQSAYKGGRTMRQSALASNGPPACLACRFPTIPSHRAPATHKEAPNG